MPKQGFTHFIRRSSLGQRSLWDWLSLLLVPTVLAIGGLWVEDQVAKRQQELEDERAKQAMMLEEQRAKEEALQAYLDQMSELILAHNLRRCDVAEEQCYEARLLAQARTVTVLQRLDSDQTQHVIGFLQVSDLLGAEDPSEDPETAGKKARRLVNTSLSGADLAGTDLGDADLSFSDLSGADLHEAYLDNTKLEYAHLIDADLSNAYMVGANLGEAELTKVDLSAADLSGAYLGGAYKITEDGSKKLITAAELEQQTKLLEGATMPNGQKYEDWLESQGSGEE